MREKLPIELCTKPLPRTNSRSAPENRGNERERVGYIRVGVLAVVTLNQICWCAQVGIQAAELST